jgi:hypothetical protein
MEALETLPRISLNNLIYAYNILLGLEEDIKPDQVIINLIEVYISINIKEYSWTQRMELMFIIRTIIKDKATKEKIQIIQYKTYPRLAIYTESLTDAYFI